jgi:hypothetical protein
LVSASTSASVLALVGRADTAALTATITSSALLTARQLKFADVSVLTLASAVLAATVHTPPPWPPQVGSVTLTYTVAVGAVALTQLSQDTVLVSSSASGDTSLSGTAVGDTDISGTTQGDTEII